MDFSEESRLLIEHWDTFQDAMRAYERLEEEEIPQLVESIVRRVEDEDWSEGWELREDRHPRVRFYNPSWMMGDDTVLNVGTGKLKPNALFGSADPPRLRVLVHSKYRELAERLLQEMEERDLIAIGEAEHSRIKIDIISCPLQKCPPESPEGYADALEEQTYRFLEHYLPTLMDLDDVIQEELGKYRS